MKRKISTLSAAVIALFTLLVIAPVSFAESNAIATMARILTELNHYPSAEHKATLAAISKDEANSEATRAAGAFGARDDNAASAAPKRRNASNVSACTPGRTPTGTSPSTALSDRPPRTASMASALWSSRRAKGGDSGAAGIVAV